MPASNDLRTQVLDAVIASWRVVDQEQGHGQEQRFTEHASYSTAGATFTGRAEIADALAARVAAGTRTSRHVLSNWTIDELTARRARLHYLVTLYAAMGEPPRSMTGQPIAVGDIDDVLVCSDDGDPWLIESRRFTPIFIADDQGSPFLNGTPSMTTAKDD